MADYPDNIFTGRELENLPGENYNTNEKTTLFAEDINKLNDEVHAIEDILDTNPQGIYTSVAERLANLPYRIEYFSEIISTQLLDIASLDLQPGQELFIVFYIEKTVVSPLNLYFNQITESGSYSFITKDINYAGAHSESLFGDQAFSAIQMQDTKYNNYYITLKVFYMPNTNEPGHITCEWVGTATDQSENPAIGHIQGSGSCNFGSDLQSLQIDAGLEYFSGYFYIYRSN